jgi:hypothetical protein
MKKISFKKISLLSVIILVLFVSAISAISFSHAEDDEDERYERDNDRSWLSEREEENVEPEVTTPAPVVESAPVITVTPTTATPVTTTASPVVNNSKTQTIVVTTNNKAAILAALRDSDQDGVTDLLDKHPGEDDYAYSLLDKNNNGVDDNLEILLK